MKEEKKKLKKNVCSGGKTEKLPPQKWAEVCKKTIIVLMSGGESSRFKEVAGAANVHKNAYRLPNGDTMMEMTIRMYRDAGIKNFIALIREQSQSVIEVLGNGEKLGVKVIYCHDPLPPAGRGGVMRHAYEEGKLSNENYLIIHNPDDLIFDFPGSFPRHILEGHVSSEKNGALASYVVCEGTPYTFSGMQIKDGRILETEYCPFIPIPTHIGVTIFSPGLKDLFVNRFNYSEKMDFENTLLPELSKKGKVFAVEIKYRNWYPVNNLKNYKQLLAKLGI